MTRPNRRTLYHGKILDLVLEDEKWEIVEHAPAVVILAMDGERMLVVRQFRRGADVTTLEAPAGLIDDGESPEAAARRELAEEASLDGDLELLSHFYSSPGFTSEHLYLFRATNLREGRGERDEDEHDLEVLWVDPEALLADLRAGRAETSAPTVAAALFALVERARG